VWRDRNEGKLPSDLETKKVSGSPLGIVAHLREVGFAPSNSNAKRLVEQGAVTVNGVKVTDAKSAVTIAGECVLKAGKLKICKVAL